MNSFPGTDFILASVFGLFVLATVSGALIAVLTVRIIRSVCGLAMCCVGVAGLFYFLNSPFLAFMEILIYVGAVCVTIIFAVMLAEPDEQLPEKQNFSTVFWSGSGLVVSGAIFWGLTHLGVRANWPKAGERLNDGSLEAIGTSLLTTYSMAFELISLVLFVAIVGALAIARIGRSKQ